jgi:hypothetical protein
MGVTATTVEIARGVTMPFLPMKSHVGQPLRTKTEIKKVVERLDDDQLLIQPSITGTRVCLAVVDRKIFIQDEQGKWVVTPPSNGRDFLKLPNNTCLDGYITHQTFFAADCIAVGGQTLICKVAAEREAVAYQLCKFLGHPWRFQRPSAKFIRAAKSNLPEVQGLTFKDYMSVYAMLSSKSQPAKEWLRRSW